MNSYIKYSILVTGREINFDLKSSTDNVTINYEIQLNV